jgi:hypothetical protein
MRFPKDGMNTWIELCAGALRPGTARLGIGIGIDIMPVADTDVLSH